MGSSGTIEGDQSAKRAAETFVEVYQVTLIRIEQHLEDIIHDAGENYAEGYKPWQKALHDLLDGAFLLSKNQPVKRDSLKEALHVFSFESSARFMGDLCTSIGIRKERGWEEDFHDHIKTLSVLVGDSPSVKPVPGA